MVGPFETLGLDAQAQPRSNLKSLVITCQPIKIRSLRLWDVKASKALTDILLNCLQSPFSSVEKEISAVFVFSQGVFCLTVWNAGTQQERMHVFKNMQEHFIFISAENPLLFYWFSKSFAMLWSCLMCIFPSFQWQRDSKPLAFAKLECRFILLISDLALQMGPVWSEHAWSEFPEIRKSHGVCVPIFPVLNLTPDLSFAWIKRF